MDTSVTAGIRTHILLLTPELESGKLDRSATTLHNVNLSPHTTGDDIDFVDSQLSTAMISAIYDIIVSIHGFF